MRRTTAGCLLLLFVSACDDSSTGSSEGADVSGSWSYSALDLESETGITCSFTGIQATIQQSDGTFMGTTQGGEWACTSPFGPLGDNLNPQTISEGQLNGNQVDFQIEGILTFSHSGVLSSSNSMTGTVEASGTVAPVGQITLTGSWSATR